jgi:hypothetical protein
MTRKALLLSTAAAAALAAGMTSKAMAFDDVDWDWTKTVTTIEQIKVITNVTINFDGLVELEKWQLNFGNVHSDAEVHNISNHPFEGATAGGSVDIDELVDLKATYSGGVDPQPIAPGNPEQVGDTGLNAAIVGGDVKEGKDTIEPQIHIYGTVSIDPSDFTGFDAADLPEVANAATSVGNNQSITTTTALELHDLQVNAGAIDPIYSAWYPGGEDWYGNSSQEVAEAVILGALLGVIEPSHITAEAHVSDILNAFVDNSATAVGNNASYTVNASIPGNAYVIADLVQLNIGNERADASVRNVRINDYTGFGDAGFGLAGLGDNPITPIVNNVATAVGNNLSITVNGCATCTPAVGGP